MNWLAVAVAGAAGAVVRYALGVNFGGRAFPWVTLVINVGGSFLLGYLLGGPLNGTAASPFGLGATVGFLGAFTTFSTFGYETVTLLREERAGAAVVYVVASVLLGVGAAALGYWCGKILTE